MKKRKPLPKKLRKLLIFDGNNMVRRMEYVRAFQRLSYKGQPTGIIHGSVNAILRDIDDTKADEVAVIFDGLGAKQVKQKTYDGYKAKRGTMSDVTAGQMQLTKEILRAAGIFCFQEPQMDADDVIGCLARMWVSVPDIAPRSVIIRSNDKDFGQLCDSITCQWKPVPGTVNGEFWYNEDVRREFRLWKASYIADYLAIVGDGVDGIPGLPGVGPKTAMPWLEEYGNIEGLLANYEGPKRAFLDEHADMLRKYLKLTRINTRCLSPAAIREIEPKLTPQPYSKRLMPLLHQHGLWNIMNRLKLSTSVTADKGGIFG